MTALFFLSKSKSGKVLLQNKPPLFCQKAIKYYISEPSFTKSERNVLDNFFLKMILLMTRKDAGKEKMLSKEEDGKNAKL